MAEFFLNPSNAAAFGLMCAFFSLLFQAVKDRSKSPNLAVVIVSFLGGSLIPCGFVLILFPFLEIKPILEDIGLYLPIAGLAIVWAGLISIIQAFDVEDNSGNA